MRPLRPPCRFVKGLYFGTEPRGQHVGEDAILDNGKHGIRIGDGYHDCT
jgi:hypothetical protein